MKDKKTDEITTYHYVDLDEGRMGARRAYQVLKKLNKQAWLHLFRHSLATQMAEQEATEEQHMAWFDWDRYDTAHNYVRGGPRLTRKWSQRKW